MKVKPQHAWTPEQVDQVVHLYKNCEWDFSEIVKKTNIGFSSVRTKLINLGLFTPKSKLKKDGITKLCLQCEQPFLSWDKVKNRRCNDCKRKED